MGWSYDPAELATNEVYAIRLEIGDTDPRNQKLQDEEISYAISVERNFWSGAARCAEVVARNYLSKADVKLGRAMSIVYTKASEQYFQMAIALRRKALGSQVPYFGGVSITQKIALEQNSDLVAPAFTRTMQENPWTGGYTSDSLPPVSVSGAYVGTPWYWYGG